MKSLAVLLLFSVSVLAKSPSDTEIKNISDFILSTPVTQLSYADFSFYTPVVRESRNLLRERLTAQLNKERKKVRLMPVRDYNTGKWTEGYYQTFKHFEIERILKNFNSNFPYFYRMEELGLDVFSAQTLLIQLKNLQSHDNENDRDSIRSFITHIFKSKSIGYRVRNYLNSSPILNYCKSELARLKPH